MHINVYNILTNRVRALSLMAHAYFEMCAGTNTAVLLLRMRTIAKRQAVLPLIGTCC